MTVLHVREQGAVVRKDGERVQVTHKEKTSAKQIILAGAPIRDLTQVAVYGNVQVTTQATALLLEHDIDLVFLSMYGKFRGRLTKSGSKFARLRHAQLRLAGDEERALTLAKAIVQSKLHNQRLVLQEIAALPAATAVAPQLQAAAQRIAMAERTGMQALDGDSLRGYEGQAGAAYFEAVGALLPSAWNFAGRQYFPAPDPFNALLSFGYALLQKDLSAALQLVGLDPFLGCFHALEYDRPSLTLDLMEEFRPLIVDHTMLALVRNGAVRPADFTFTKRKQRPVELGEVLIPKIIDAYEQRLQSRINHAPSRTQVTLRRALELQAQRYAQVVMGERTAYEGVTG
ncbi:MAG: CRISPR-associated endonuclease Cas1 [Caldilineaceae bacterium]